MAAMQITHHVRCRSRQRRDKLIPTSAPTDTPYCARRKLLPAFVAAKLRGGLDSTEGISEEREHRVP
jgi:hypothetical protein